MRKAFLALVLVVLGSCDAGANCGGCAPPRSSVVEHAQVNVTSAPLDSAPTESVLPAPSLPPSPSPLPEPSIAAPQVIAPPAETASARVHFRPRVMVDPTAGAIDAAPPVVSAIAPPVVPSFAPRVPAPTVSAEPSVERTEPVEDAEVPAGVDASPMIMGESESGSPEDAAPE